ncbi:hypothetical protein ABZP36_021835 [Zizania latifolia]
MEVTMRSASPLPLRDFQFDSAAASPYATAPSSPSGRLATAASPFMTAPPSPNPFDDLMLPPETPRLTGANPFDLFHPFSSASAPASPRRAAAIYAQFAEGNNAGKDEEENDDCMEFHPRASYTTNASAVPFDWEERPGTPKAGLGGAVWDTDFEFGTLVDKTAPEQNLTTADELFEKGKIRPLKPPQKTTDELSDKGKVRPLKPPPGLLDGGSVASSPRSPMSRGGLWSPRRRSRVGSGVDFDPFAAALLEATKAPSPLGGKEANGVAAPGSPPKKAEPFTTRPASKSTGWRRWPLIDLLFRSSSERGRVNKDPIFKYSPVQHPDAPVKKASAQPTTSKTNDKADFLSKPKKHAGDKNASAADGILGSVRLSPLQRLAKGLRGSSWYYGRSMTALGTKG